MTDAVLLNSGGIDSRVAAHIMWKKGWALHSLHIPFNPHNREACREAAKTTARMYCKEYFEANAPDNWMCWSDRGFEHWPHTGSYVITMGATYAHYHGIQYIVSGLRSDNVPPNWRQQAQDFLAGSKITPGPVLVFPVFDDGASDAGVRKAKELGIDISDTHSCWQDPACGTCHKCSARESL